MDAILQAIDEALASKNWHAALFMSLSAPDVCASLCSETGKSNRTMYADWFNEYVGKRYKRQASAFMEEHTFLSGNDCYALRCTALHRGDVDISDERCREALDSFHFTTTGSHCNQVEGVLQLDVRTFCQDICAGVREWESRWICNDSQHESKKAQLLTIHTGPSTVGGMVRFG